MNTIKLFIFALLMCANGVLLAQKDITTFGIQYKPIIPNRIIGTLEQTFNAGTLESSIRQKMGHSFGMIVRHGLNKNISLETGIAITKRNFQLNFAVPDSNLSATGKVTTINYEIPLSGLIYIQLGEQFFMNTAIGASLNYYPSDVKVNIPIDSYSYFTQEAARMYRVNGSLLANIGFEYRTRSLGYFYLGASYNLPFAPIATFAMAYKYQGGAQVARDNVRGSYATIDFRYFFHEEKQLKKKK